MKRWVHGTADRGLVNRVSGELQICLAGWDWKRRRRVCYFALSFYRDALPCVSWCLLASSGVSCGLIFAVLHRYPRKRALRDSCVSPSPWHVVVGHQSCDTCKATWQAVRWLKPLFVFLTRCLGARNR